MIAAARAGYIFRCISSDVYLPIYIPLSNGLLVMRGEQGCSVRQAWVASGDWQECNMGVAAYCAKALACEEWASKTRDPIARQRFIDTAKGWRELAEQVERGTWVNWFRHHQSVVYPTID